MTLRSTAPVSTSTNRAVIRICGPKRWNAPATIQRAPRPRPISIANRSSCADSCDASRLRSASYTRSRPITVMPGTFFRSAVTVSAMPEPIHSSTGSRVMLANVMTAMEFSGGAARPRLPLLREPDPDSGRTASSSIDRSRVRST